MKKWLSVLLAGAMVLGTLTGCSGGGKKAENEVKTLDVVWFSDGKEGEILHETGRQVHGGESVCQDRAD